MSCFICLTSPMTSRPMMHIVSPTFDIGTINRREYLPMSSHEVDVGTVVVTSRYRGLELYIYIYIYIYICSMRNFIDCQLMINIKFGPLNI